LRAVPVGGRVRALCAKLGSPHPGHICTGTGLIPATSAPGLASPLPHLCRDWGLTLPTSAAGTVHCTRLPHLHRRLDEPADGVGRTAMPQQCATRAHLRRTGAPTPSSCGTARREAQRACAARHRLSAHVACGTLRGSRAALIPSCADQGALPPRAQPAPAARSAGGRTKSGKGE
jgi:hypothetical protein